MPSNSAPRLAATSPCSTCFSTASRSRSRWLNVSISSPGSVCSLHSERTNSERGHFYFNQTGHFYFNATATVDGALLKVSLSGGAPALLVRAGRVSQLVYFPHWGDDETIVFGNPIGSFQVPETGGELTPLSAPEPILFPHQLPGGWAVLGSRVTGGVVLLDLAADTIRELNPVGFKPKYVETGHILYLDGSGGLWALPFDAANGDVLGDAVPILDGVSVIPFGQYRFPRYSVSRNGTLAYGAGGGAAEGGATWPLVVVDLEGNEVELPQLSGHPIS